MQPNEQPLTLLFPRVDDRKVTTTLGGIFQPDLQVNSFVTLKVGGVDTFKIEFSLLWARSVRVRISLCFDNMTFFS